jgi:hypothetical protein
MLEAGFRFREITYFCLDTKAFILNLVDLFSTYENMAKIFKILNLKVKLKN